MAGEWECEGVSGSACVRVGGSVTVGFDMRVSAREGEGRERKGVR